MKQNIQRLFYFITLTTVIASVSISLSNRKKIKEIQKIKDTNISYTYEKLDIKGERDLFFDLINSRHENIIILRIKELSCMSCISEQIKTWNAIFDSKKKYKMIVLTEFKNPNNFELFKKNGKLKGNKFNTYKSEIKNKIELQNSPYVVLISKDNYIIKHLLINNESNESFNKFIKAYN